MSSRLQYQDSFIYQKLSSKSNGFELLRNIADKVDKFVSSGLADKHFRSEFYSQEKAKFYQRLWEMNLAFYLLDQGLVLSSSNIGPDFSTELDGKKIWFEAVSPTPQGNLIGYFDIPQGESFIVRDYPFKSIMLRITSVLSEKKNKLIKYINNGIVSESDICIIAVDCSQLDFAAHTGISQKPVVLEAVYPVGPRYISIDRETSAHVDHGYSYEDKVDKISDAKSVKVEKDLFMLSEYAHVSGVMSAVSDLSGVKHSVFVHNINAINPFFCSKFVVDEEYVPSKTTGLLSLHNVRYSDV